MKHRSRPRAFALPALLALSLVSMPLPARALGPAAAPAADAVVGASKFGALMAIACGASINIARHAPDVPIIAVAVATCLAAFIDAACTPD